MSSPYERVKGGRLTFKDGSVGKLSKGIDKKKKKKNKQKQILRNPSDDAAAMASVDLEGDEAIAAAEAAAAGELGAGGEEEEESYSIDAAKKMHYDELFPVEAKKFGYDPKATKKKSVEAILDDRVKKKADRYCK